MGTLSEVPGRREGMPLKGLLGPSVSLLPLFSVFCLPALPFLLQLFKFLCQPLSKPSRWILIISLFVFSVGNRSKGLWTEKTKTESQNKLTSRILSMRRKLTNPERAIGNAYSCKVSSLEFPQQNVHTCLFSCCLPLHIICNEPSLYLYFLVSVNGT